MNFIFPSFSWNPLVKTFPWNTLNFMQVCFHGCQICVHVICEETENSFKITEAVSDVKYADIVLGICFSIGKLKIS